MTQPSADNPVLLVGAGKMGGAMLAGWLASGHAGDHFAVVDPMPAPDINALLLRHAVPCMAAVPMGIMPSAVIVAVKPQMMADVLPSLRVLNASHPVFVSIAAGTAVATFEKVLGSGAAIVRAMPNTPAQVGRGITIGFANSAVSAVQKALVQDLLSVTGAFDWVSEETLIDAVTAVSGSGPAYVFYLVEAMAEAAQAAGIDADLAMKLARATVEGAGELLYLSDLDPATLRQNVTSPGGTTAAALSVLMDEKDGLAPLMARAVAAAKRRAEELGSA